MSRSALAPAAPQRRLAPEGQAESPDTQPRARARVYLCEPGGTPEQPCDHCAKKLAG
jgi:hypothetical protein